MLFRSVLRRHILRFTENMSNTFFEKIHETDLTMEYAIVSKAQQKLTTVGTATIVMFDFASNQKALLSLRLTNEIEKMNTLKSPCFKQEAVTE